MERKKKQFLPRVNKPYSVFLVSSETGKGWGGGGGGGAIERPSKPL